MTSGTSLLLLIQDLKGPPADQQKHVIHWSAGGHFKSCKRGSRGQLLVAMEYWWAQCPLACKGAMKGWPPTVNSMLAHLAWDLNGKGMHRAGLTSLCWINSFQISLMCHLLAWAETVQSCLLSDKITVCRSPLHGAHFHGQGRCHPRLTYRWNPLASII